MGTKNATTTSTQQLPGYINSAYQNLIGSAQQTAQTPYAAYTGGFTPDQQAAFQHIGSMWGSSDPSFGAASNAYGQSMVPTSDRVSQYMSPYMSSVVDAAMANMQTQNQQQQQGVVGNAIAKGAMGGNRVGVAQAELGRQQKLADNAGIANLLQSGYGTALGAAQADKNAQLAAAQGYTGLGQTQMQTGLAQAASQLGAGTQQQQFDYSQYLNKQAFPYQQQGWLASLVGGLGSTAGGTTKQTTPQGNIFSQLLGAGLGIAGLFKDGGVVSARNHLAMGGMPYANDNGGAWPSYGSLVGGVPFANDNGDFSSYMPKGVAIAGGGGNFPAIQQPNAQEDPFADPSGMMKKGAGNLKSWLSPVDASKVKMPALFASGGVVGNRYGYAGGGVPMIAPGHQMTPEEIRALYSGVLLPQGGVVGAPVIPAAPPIPPKSNYTDAVNVLDADNLGLGVDTTAERTLPPRGEDPYLEFPAEAPVRRAPINVSGGNLPGEVPYTEGTQFTTVPKGGNYSQNGMEAIQSLFGGKGLNLAPDAKNALMTAGFGMMSSRSPFFLQGVGEGGLAGMQAWRDYQQMERENALARAGIGQRGEELAQRAIEIGANANVANAQAGSIDTATAAGRWEYRPTALGMQVIDKITGQPGVIYPYGSMMPNNEIAAQPTDGTSSPLFSTEAPAGVIDPRLATDQGAAQSIGQGTEVIKASQAEAAAAQSTQQLLQEMKHNLSQLPDQGWLSPGSDFKDRANFAKGINTYLSVFGADPYFPTGEIAAAEDLNKLTNRLGFDLSKMLGSNEAASVVMTGIESVPGGANSKAGAGRIIAGLEAANKRRIDLYHFLQNYAAKNGGSILNAEETFNRQNPPELYALSSYVPQEDMEYLRQNPDTAADFNAEYGDGKNVARFVLGR